VGCEVGCGVGFGGWLAVGVFLVDSGDFGCGYFLLICFALLQTHHVEYFLEHFLKVQTNTGKTNILL
jgi:hypothetical protein